MAQLTGAVINVYSEKALAIEAGARGTAAIALPLGWYEEGAWITFNADDTALSALGYELDDLLEIREMMKRASKALIYPLYTGGAKASASLGDKLTATAVKQGARGNAIGVTVAKSGALWQVKTFVDGSVADSQLVANAAAFKANAFIALSGEGALAASTVALTGGSNGAVADTAYDAFLEALKTEVFQVIAYTGEDAAIKQKLVDYVKRQRDDEDQFIQACVGNLAADCEGIISFANGVILTDGTVIDANMASAWLAGATAAAAVNESLTYDSYDGADSVTEKLTKSAQLVYKNQGLGCFILNNGKTKIESDINTLVTYTVKKQKDFCKNRVLRVIDGVCTDIKAVFDSSFAGAEHNNADGRNRFKASICDYMTALQGQSAIEDFVADDVVVAAGADKDTVEVTLRIKPVDSMEKANITVRVR
ncbi:MAG TPA: phage tail sheath C-terminal domain-containing protein [Clostridia bacterium]|nr:phage tail sheath C-terminal domain-containing protein [Clostridia bacterium]